MIGFALRASLVLGIALAALPLLTHAPALVRRLLLLVALCCSLAVPVISALLPSGSRADVVPVPEAVRAFAEPLEAGVAAVNAAPVSPAPAVVRWDRIVLSGWALGAGLVLLRTLRSHRRARRLGRGEIALAEVEVPAVVGIFAPTILLPPASRQWSEARLHAVLLHERAHIAHRDGLAQLIARVACAVYWFQPLVWWVARRLRLECELAADQRVVASGVRCSDYAGHLLAVARGLLAPAASLGMASELERRTRALFAPQARPWSRMRRASLWLGGAAVASALACSGAKPPASAPLGNETIDARIQAIAEEEAALTQRQWAAADVAIVVLEPSSGAVLARTGGADVARIPGSTIKPFTVAAALEDESITPDQRFDCDGGKRVYGDQTLPDANPHGVLDVRQILSVSSNVCTSKIFDRISAGRLVQLLRDLRFSAVPERAQAGSFEGAVIAAGGGLRATPLELAAAYASLVDGHYRAPTSTRTTSTPERVLREATASTIRAMLEDAVHGPLGSGKAAAVVGQRIAGKTGTSIDDGVTFASFVGLLPADRPRYVIYVGVYRPKDMGTGSKVAAPVFARIASRL